MRPLLCMIGLHRWRYFRDRLNEGWWRRCTREGCTTLKYTLYDNNEREHRNEH